MKNLNKSERLKCRLQVKLMWLVFLIVIWGLIFYLDYDFESRAVNSLILLTSSFLLLMGLMVSDKYYVTTGFEPSEKEHEDTFKAYYAMHPWETLYLKFIVFLFSGLAMISAFMIISGFF